MEYSKLKVCQTWLDLNELDYKKIDDKLIDNICYINMYNKFTSEKKKISNIFNIPIDIDEEKWNDWDIEFIEINIESKNNLIGKVYYHSYQMAINHINILSDLYNINLWFE